MSSRGIAPVIGVVGMLAVVTVLGGVVAAVVPGNLDENQSAHQAVIDIDVEPDDDNWRVSIANRGGDTLEIEELNFIIRANGEKLEHQPELPFFSIVGYMPGPEGPFNSNTADNTLSAGESGSFTVRSSTNSPAIEAGSSITIEIYDEGSLIAEATSRA